jgi:2-polyprenyl-3-methyl-5-hydroxy-6-metoxy-1,4-benzoquinol methylase
LIRAIRVVEPEMMDQPDLDVRQHRQALTALGRANVLSRTAGAVWPAVREAASAVGGRPLRVLDIACGGGHVAVSLARRAAREGIPLDVTGCDVSPVALDYARALAERSGVAGVRFVRADAARDPMPEDIDVVLCTLFLHHLADEDAAAMLRRMKDAARHRVIVSDLRRTRLGYLFAWVGCRLLSRSRVFHVDGTRSVAAALTMGEARAMAERAQLTGAEIGATWPQRWLLVWRRPETSLPPGPRPSPG